MEEFIDYGTGQAVRSYTREPQYGGRKTQGVIRAIDYQAFSDTLLNSAGKYQRGVGSKYSCSASAL
jgi:hypothetical protein